VKMSPILSLPLYRWEWEPRTYLVTNIEDEKFTDDNRVVPSG
jgi:hypothetical protein